MICIYHQGCLDGFAAAWVVWKKFIDRNVEFIAAKYGDEPPPLPLLVGKNIIIVDFSYPRDALIEINEVATSLLVLDHHRTAQANCEGVDFAIFNMDKSGAIMAWNHFFPDKQPPEFLRYIQDRDLWRFDLPSSKEVNAALYSYPFDFPKWDEIIPAKTISDLINEGQAIVRDRQKIIDSLVSGWAIQRVNIGGYYNVPCLNCPSWLASETLNILAENEPFAISYSDSADTRTFQLRSSQTGIDVSEIAEKFGGGGHKHAAGFTQKKPQLYL